MTTTNRLPELGLEGRSALVLGVGPGIGGESVRLLAAAGAHVTCADLDLKVAAAAARELPEGQGNAVQCDVRERAPIHAACQAAVEAGGGLDVVVDVVGHGREMPIESASDQDWTLMLDLNLTHQFRVMQEAFCEMIPRGGGSIISISSVNGVISSPGKAPYGAAKAALISLTRSAAIEMAPHGIRVNSVAPGPTRTPRRSVIFEGERGATYRGSIPLGTPNESADIANAVLFLASEWARTITGQTLVVDGGATVKFPLPRGN